MSESTHHSKPGVCFKARRPIGTAAKPGKCSTLSCMRVDSALEAFRHNPTHGGFGALTVQSTPSANYVNRRFLSY